MEKEIVLAVIPARGGSKGIPRKNIRPFAGKPLIAHSIEAAKNAPDVDRVIISTDDSEIASVAKQFGAEVPFLRPEELATDSARVVDAVIHTLDYLRENEQYEPTHILLLQPTSPLRTSDDITRALARMRKSGADSLVSVCRTENILLTMDRDGLLAIQDKAELASPNRQELTRYFRLDGSMIYIVRTDIFRAQRSFLAGKLVGYEIPRWKAVDLDDADDFVAGEVIFQMRQKIEDDIRAFA